MYYCAYIGSFGEFACNPRTLSSSHLNRMVSLEGIVTKCSLVRPKVIKSVHYNEKKHMFHFREYKDQTMSANGAVSTGVYPQEDDEGNPVITHSLRKPVLEYWLIYAVDHRVWVLYVSRSPDDINPRDARARSGRTAAPWGGCDYGRRPC